MKEADFSNDDYNPTKTIFIAIAGFRNFGYKHL
jgi:hypothetical protein